MGGAVLPPETSLLALGWTPDWEPPKPDRQLFHLADWDSLEVRAVLKGVSSQAQAKEARGQPGLTGLLCGLG